MAQERSAMERAMEKLRAFYEGLPDDERPILARMLSGDDGDVRGFSVEGLDAAGVTAPNFDAVIATHLLNLPEFERVASIADAVEASTPFHGGKTGAFERNT